MCCWRRRARTRWHCAAAAQSKSERECECARQRQSKRKCERQRERQEAAGQVRRKRQMRQSVELLSLERALCAIATFVPFDSVRFESVQLGSIWFHSVRFGSARLCSAQSRSNSVAILLSFGCRCRANSRPSRPQLAAPLMALSCLALVTLSVAVAAAVAVAVADARSLLPLPLPLQPAQNKAAETSADRPAAKQLPSGAAQTVLAALQCK